MGTKKTSNQKITTHTDQVVEILYQKMGSKWFSFFVLDDDVYMGSVPEEAIPQIRERVFKDGLR